LIFFGLASLAATFTQPTAPGRYFRNIMEPEIKTASSSSSGLEFQLHPVSFLLEEIFDHISIFLFKMLFCVA
jgi:hypothetical protein